MSGGKSVAKFWKNGTSVALSDGTKGSYANSIFVYGSKVYISGKEGLWKGVAKYQVVDNGKITPYVLGNPSVDGSAEAIALTQSGAALS